MRFYFYSSWGAEDLCSGPRIIYPGSTSLKEDRYDFIGCQGHPGSLQECTDQILDHVILILHFFFWFWQLGANNQRLRCLFDWVCFAFPRSVVGVPEQRSQQRTHSVLNAIQSWILVMPCHPQMPRHRLREPVTHFCAFDYISSWYNDFVLCSAPEMHRESHIPFVFRCWDVGRRGSSQPGRPWDDGVQERNSGFCVLADSRRLERWCSKIEPDFASLRWCWHSV